MHEKQGVFGNFESNIPAVLKRKGFTNATAQHPITETNAAQTG
jgi:hypothetical protein